MAPFSRGEKEKGFRDALVLESFCQLVQASPKTPAVCRMIILVQDELLARTIEQRLDGARNVKIFQSIAELEEFINSLASKVTEDFIKSIRGKVHNLFIEKGNDNNIYLKMNVREQIQE